MDGLDKTLMRIRQLQSEKAVAETKHADARAEHSALCAELKETYGTDDSIKLKMVLSDREQELESLLKQAREILNAVPQA